MSFKVICVDNEFFPAKGEADIPILTVGAIYTVVEITNNPIPMYVLEEVPVIDHQLFEFDADAFIRLGGPDERAILESRYDAEVARMDEEFRQNQETL